MTPWSYGLLQIFFILSLDYFTINLWEFLKYNKLGSRKNTAGCSRQLVDYQRH